MIHSKIFVSKEDEELAAEQIAQFCNSKQISKNEIIYCDVSYVGAQLQIGTLIWEEIELN